MERYNYPEAVRDDVLEAIREDYTPEEIREKLQDRDEFEQELNDDFWTADSVTGNASGSYYCNAWKAEEAIAHNLELLGEALAEFGSDPGDLLKQGAEAADVTIRCYLLGAAISEALDILEEELPPLDPSEYTPAELIQKTSCFDSFCACFSCSACPFDVYETREDCERRYNELKKDAQQ